jgi:acyl-CoA thioester hydrolase
MDANRHVNNVAYLRWFESARVEYFARIGAMAGSGTGPVIVQSTMRWKLALRWPDTVRAAATVLRIGDTSFTMGQRLFSFANDRAVAADAEAVLVWLGPGGKKTRVPDEVRRRVDELEASAPDPETLPHRA